MSKLNMLSLLWKRLVISIVVIAVVVLVEALLLTYGHNPKWVLQESFVLGLVLSIFAMELFERK